MHYLTNYYKNLSEQLQEKVNNLQKFLNEGSPSDYPGSSDYERSRRNRYGSPYDTASKQFYSPGYDAIAAMSAYQNSVSAIENHPESQRLMIDALAGTWTEQHGGQERRERGAFRRSVTDRLRAASGPEGFKSFDHAAEAMLPIILSTPSWRKEATENLRQKMHPDKFENIDLERELKKMAKDHVLEVQSDAVRHAETKAGFLN